METRTRNTIRAPRRMFGKSRRRQYYRPTRPPLEVTQDTSIWEIYNNQAETVDDELIRDWNDSLNTLLIFAALYSAVLTAFIIESMKLLQEDSSDTARDILLGISKQLANRSIPAYEITPFITPKWAIRVNCCFFVSISCSLATALSAVLALQWVNSYDRGLNPSSPEERALQRHFRNQGVHEWKMDQIIGTLPGVIYISLFLFSVGLAEWLWHLHRYVAATIVVGIVIGTLFFTLTTWVSVNNATAPFRTPVSRFLPRALWKIRRKSIAAISYMTSGNLIRDLAIFTSRLKSTAPVLFTWCGKPNRWPSLTWHAPRPFEMRERDTIASSIELKRDSLIWLAQSISITPHERSSLIILVQEFLNLPPEQLVKPCLNRAPWRSIFTLLCQPYIGKKGKRVYTPDQLTPDQLEEVIFLLRAIASIGSGKIVGYDFMEFFLSLEGSPNNVAKTCAALAIWKAGPETCLDSCVISSQRAEWCYIDAIRGARHLPPDLVLVSLLNVAAYQSSHHSIYRLDAEKLLVPIADWIDGSDILQSSGRESMIRPDILFTVLELVTTELTQRAPERHVLVTDYLASMEDYIIDRPESFVHKAHKAIVTQFCIRWGTLSSQGEVDRVLLEHLLQFVISPMWYGQPLSTTIELLKALSRTHVSVWRSAEQVTLARILAVSLPNRYKFDGGDWTTWWIKVLIGLDSVISASETEADSIRQDALEICRAALDSDIRPNTRPNTPLNYHQSKKLMGLQDPCLRFIASIAMQSDQLMLCLLPLSPTLRDDYIWHANLQWYLRRQDSAEFLLNIDFLREIALIDSTIQAYEVWYYVCPLNYNPTRALKYLKYPMLPILLQRHHDSSVARILSQVCGSEWFTDEFTRANGFEWLSTSAFDTRSRLEWAYYIIHSACGTTNTYSDLCTWVTCARDCLISAWTWRCEKSGRALRHQHKENTSRFSAYLKLVTRRWANMRSNGGIYRPHSFEAVDASNDRRLPAQEGSRVKIPECNVMEWEPELWKEWNTLVSEVVPGLRRGYITVGPSEECNRYVRDPEGVCARI